MCREVNTRCEAGRVVAAVAFSGRWGAKEDASNGARFKLMRHSGGYARIAETTKDAKLIIRGWCIKEKMMGCKVPVSMIGADVNEE